MQLSVSVISPHFKGFVKKMTKIIIYAKRNAPCVKFVSLPFSYFKVRKLIGMKQSISTKFIIRVLFEVFFKIILLT